MEREKFAKLVEEVLDALPPRFRKRIHNRNNVRVEA
jgi:predicted Zn-dependent protease with MMP-like domain